MKIEFVWDISNTSKSLTKHGIYNDEAESVFNDKDKLILYDEKHSVEENRYICYGISSKGHLLMTCFTIRNEKIRIISTRIANIKERRIYENSK